MAYRTQSLFKIQDIFDCESKRTGVGNPFCKKPLCREPFMSGTLSVMNLYAGNPLCQESLYQKLLCWEPFMLGTFWSGTLDIENSLGREPLYVGNHKGREILQAGEPLRPGKPFRPGTPQIGILRQLSVFSCFNKLQGSECLN